MHETSLAKAGLLASALAALLGLAACSTVDEERINYKSAAKGVSLDVPPDLTQLTRDNRYALPGTPVNASGFVGAQSGPVNTVAANRIGDVRVERAGSQRWLVVDRPADKLWEPVHDFWQSNGFVLTIDQQNLGIMETDWAENRAKIPQDFIRNAIGKVFDGLYSTGERDKFRTRFERNAEGGTEIYISHRGMQEKVRGQVGSPSDTVWEPRNPDPELEAEFLRRLMVRLGVGKEQAQTVVAAAAQDVKPLARVTSANGIPVVQVDEGFDRAWRRVGLALDRTGFTVEDRDRNQGIYFVRYVEPDRKEPGFFSKVFGSGKEAGPLKYRVTLRSQGESTTVSVLNAQGAPESSPNVQRILQVIADDLR